MDGLASNSRLRFWVAVTATTTVVILTVYLLRIRPIIRRISRRRKSDRLDGLHVISEPENAEDVTFEIVAVHGLGADSEHTWTAAAVESPDSKKKDHRRVHLLKDLLKNDFPHARISAFAHNSDWLIDAPVTTAQQIGHRLLDDLVHHRSKHRRVPIIFIGHSFGGIVIKEALCKSGDTARDTIDSTSGIIFLGTPHQGSLLSTPGAILALATGILGSETGLLISLTSHRMELVDLDVNFVRCIKEKEQRTRKTEIVAFCEKKSTYFAGISVGRIVSADSARGGHAPETVYIDTDHSGLNKCRSSNDELYIQLRQSLLKLSKNMTSTLNSNQNFVINKLRTVEEAPFNSSANQHDPICLKETRRELLQDIDQWAKGPITGKHIYWLEGKAGTGKSTIARTVAGTLNERGLLGASFFFKRNESGRANAGYLFSTIAAQLARRLPAAAEHMRNAIECEPEIATMAFQAQLRELVVRPMLKTIPAGINRTMTVVIDALDECDRPDDIITVIKLLLQTDLLTVAPLKFFITSRDKFPIRTDRQGGQCRSIQFLVDKIPTSIVERDIANFLSIRLDDIREKFDMTSSWPDQRQFQTLLKKSVPLFIFAATACRFIEDRRQSGGVQGRLQKILQNEHHGQFNQIYLPILNQMISELSDSATREALREFNLIVGSIVTLADPLGAAPLARLLGITTDCVDDRLSLLHSVLDIPRDAFSPVRIFHESFRDFLVQVDSVDGQKFQIDETATHKILADRCIWLLDEGGVLKKDICDLREAGKLRTTIDQEVIDDNLPSEAQYACLYWVHHVKGSAVMLSYGHRVLQFLQNHLLHWFEALSLLGKISESINLLGELQVLFSADHNSSISDFLYDAKRFILQNRQMADYAPLQLYSSGLVFAPKTSVVRRNFQGEFPSWVCQLPEVLDGWSSVLQNLDGHSKSVGSVAFSPNGLILASAAYEQTVRLWDTSTGTLKQALKSSYRMKSVAFSPDGLILGAGSCDAVVLWFWEIATGVLQRTLEAPSREGWSASVNSIAFADQRILASGCNDGIRIWDTATGALQHIIDGHSHCVNQVVFSSDDCHMLASASADKTVRLWDTRTGALKQILEGHSDDVRSVAFSPCGHIVASGSEDKTVRLWDAVSGTLKSTFDHPSFVDSVSFSADGRTLASSCGEKDVQLWDTNTCSLQHTLRGNASHVKSVVFSPDSQMLASSAMGNTVQLWDAGITEYSQQSLSRDHVLLLCYCLSPNGQTLASAWVSPFGHKTIQLWDMAKGKLIWTCTRVERKTLAFELYFSPNSQMLVSVFRDDRMELWDLKTGTATLRATLNAYCDADYTIQFSPNNETIACCTDEKTVGIYDTKMGTLQRTLEGHSSQVISVAFSPNSQILASASKDKSVRLWDIATGALNIIINGCSYFRGSLAFSPTGQVLLSSSVDNTTQLWDAASGALKCTIDDLSGTGGKTAVSHAKALSHNGQMLACCFDNTIRLWDAETATLRQTWTFVGFLQFLEFSLDDLSLKTDLGSFDIESKCGTGSSRAERKLAVSLQDEQWVALNGERVLFLPAEARTDQWVARDRKIALGLSFGEFLFMEFNGQSSYQ